MLEIENKIRELYDMPVDEVPTTTEEA
jgi:hypothetical protein